MNAHERDRSSAAGNVRQAIVHLRYHGRKLLLVLCLLIPLCALWENVTYHDGYCITESTRRNRENKRKSGVKVETGVVVVVMGDRGHECF